MCQSIFYDGGSLATIVPFFGVVESIDPLARATYGLYEYRNGKIPVTTKSRHV
jgi:hypothetical protein